MSRATDRNARYKHATLSFQNYIKRDTDSVTLKESNVPQITSYNVKFFWYGDR